MSVADICHFFFWLKKCLNLRPEAMDSNSKVIFSSQNQQDDDLWGICKKVQIKISQ